MEFQDFVIGQSFWTATGEWRCTDIGTRIVAAIKIDKDDPSWYNGPPYAVAETVMDEYDFGGCYASREERDADREADVPERTSEDLSTATRIADGPEALRAYLHEESERISKERWGRGHDGAATAVPKAGSECEPGRFSRR
jgi:hypothetical protein